MSTTTLPIDIGAGKRAKVALDDRTNDPIADCMRAGSLPQPDFLDFVRALLQDRGRDTLVVDLGCHLGTFSIPLAADGFSLLCIDANKKNVVLLEETARLNGWRNLQTLWAAVSDRSGVVGLLYDGPYGIVTDDASGEVPCFTLDEIIGNRRVSLVKLDIEGSEAKAIRGARTTLTANPDLVVICESNKPLLERAGSSPGELWAAFTSLGFRCYEFLGKKLIPRTGDDLQERTVTDFVAVRAESFKVPSQYVIAPPTVEESIEMFLTDVKYGHAAHVRRALAFASPEIRADKRLAQVLTEV
jgi:FkbM family methyltransferase